MARDPEEPSLRTGRGQNAFRSQAGRAGMYPVGDGPRGRASGLPVTLAPHADRSLSIVAIATKSCLVVCKGVLSVVVLALRPEFPTQPECHRRRVLCHEAGGGGKWF
jgi:hypothetical protein